jgi:hypothetical protein
MIHLTELALEKSVLTIKQNDIDAIANIMRNTNMRLGSLLGSTLPTFRRIVAIDIDI